MEPICKMYGYDYCFHISEIRLLEHHTSQPVYLKIECSETAFWTTLHFNSLQQGVKMEARLLYTSTKHDVS